MGRSLVAFAAGVLVACAVPPSGPTPLADAGCADAAPLACDRPATIDVAAVVDLASFRAQASAAVCDWSLRCDWGFTDSFCHPRFAALEAARAGAPQGAFDLAAARGCVRGLAAASTCSEAWTTALDCDAVSVTGGTAVAHNAVPALLEGAACAGVGDAICAFGLVCLAGACVARGHVGDACDPAHPCADALVCELTCRLPRVGEACGGAWGDCAPGLACDFGWPSTPADVCDVPTCPLQPRGHHVGCACATDFDCPLDVAVCDGGTCTLRPFLGDPCRADGPPCFGSACDGSVCVPVPRGGECFYPSDCATGLVCGLSPGWFSLVCT